MRSPSCLLADSSSKTTDSGIRVILGNGLKEGQLTFHAEGSFYAEYDVVRTHPGNEGLFVEAVNAWGRNQQIRAEPRLMPMVP